MTCMVYLITSEGCRNRKVVMDKISCSDECPERLFLQRMTPHGEYEEIGCLSYDGNGWFYRSADTAKGKDRVLRR